MTIARNKAVLIGSDIDVIYSYYRYHINLIDTNIISIIYTSEEPPTDSFKGVPKKPLRIHPNRRLENVIERKKIQICYIISQNVPISQMNSIIFRIMSTRRCNIEFITKDKLMVKSHKPIISLTSLNNNIFNPLISQYICSDLFSKKFRVSVILPRQGLPNDNPIILEELPVFIIDTINREKKSLNDFEYNLAISLIDSGAYKVFLSHDINKSIILAEQQSDIILYYPFGCEIPYVNHKIKFCIADYNSLIYPTINTKWPGFVNIMDSDGIIVFLNEKEINNKNIIKKIKKLFFEKSIYFVSNIDKNLINQKENNEKSNNTNSNIFVSNILQVPFCEKIKELPLIERKKSLSNFLNQTFVTLKQPTLKRHFECQVNLIEAFVNASLKELKVSNNYSSNRETFCRLFLSGHIPPGFRVTTGEIIDSRGSLTGQLDVVIVNPFSPRMTHSVNNALIGPILADTVLGVIEVKTTLYESSLKKALSQLRPVRSLMTKHTTLLSPEGEIIDDPLGGKILTGVFAFNITPGIDSLIPNILFSFPNVVDFIVVVGHFGYFSVEILNICFINTQGIEPIGGYIKFEAKGMELAVLFAIFNSIASIRRFSGVNCIRYIEGRWDVNEYFLETKSSNNLFKKINLLKINHSKDEIRSLLNYVNKFNKD